MALITYVDMIESAGKSITEGGALFKNPVGEGLSDLSTVGFSMGFLEKCVADPLSVGEYVEPTLDSSISNLTSQIGSHITQKMENLPKDLALAVAAEQNALTISSIDAKVTGDQLNLLVDPIKAAFTDEGGCPLTDAAFKTITDTPGVLSGVKQGVESAVAGISGIAVLYQSVGSALGTAITSASQLLDGIASATASGMQSAVEQAIRSTSQAYPSIASGITSSVASASNAIASAQEEFTNLVQTEVDALAGITKQINSMQIISLLNSNSTCVKNVMSTIARPEAINPVVLDTLKNPREFTVDKEEAVAVVTSLQPIPSAEPIEIHEPPPPPSVDSQQYNQEELDEMYVKCMGKNAETKAKKEEAAEYYSTEIMAWWREVKYFDVRRAVWNPDANGFWDVESDEFKAGASTAQINQYKTLRTEYLQRRDQYNNVKLAAVKTAAALEDEYFLEFNRRKRYGRNVYTNMANAGTYSSSVSDTTYLDSSV